MENVRERKVIKIEAKPGRVMSEYAKYKLSALVPAGKLTTETSMEKYLAGLFGVHWVHFRSDYERMFAIAISGGTVDYPNRHRVVSDAGFVYLGEEQKLIDEGFELIIDKRTPSSRKVKDFKKHLFDFEVECIFDQNDFAEYIMGDKL